MTKNTKKNSKAAIYVRVSTEEQAKEGFSLLAQEQTLKEYAKTLGYEIYKIYKDEGKSAKDLHRPALQQMLKDAEKHYFSAIIVYKLDRFSRSLKDLILTIEKLKEIEIDFISMQDRIETASASGKLMFHIISSFAEFERDIISERTKFGMTEKAKEGGIVSKAPLGYKISNGKLLVEHEQAEKVRVIFNDYLNSGQSLNRIAKKHGLTVRGLLKVLKNKTYIGEITFKETYTGQHEPIIEKELFEKVQEKLNQEKIKRVKKKYEKTLIMLFKDKEKIKPLLELLLSGELTLEEKKIPEGDIKETIKNMLKEEGFNEEEIFYNRVYVNADNPWISAIHEQRKVYIEYQTEKYNKIIEYINEGIELWFIAIDTKKGFILRNI